MNAIPRIYVDPGHSLVDPGAVGYEVERDLNEKVSKYQAEHLQANYVCEVKVDPVENNSEEEEVVLLDWANQRSIVHTAMTHHMSERKVNNLRRRIRLKYDRVQPYTDLPKRNIRP